MAEPEVNRKLAAVLSAFAPRTSDRAISLAEVAFGSKPAEPGWSDSGPLTGVELKETTGKQTFAADGLLSGAKQKLWLCAFNYR